MDLAERFCLTVCLAKYHFCIPLISTMDKSLRLHIMSDIILHFSIIIAIFLLLVIGNWTFLCTLSSNIHFHTTCDKKLDFFQISYIVASISMLLVVDNWTFFKLSIQ